jgi:hypothetical protein
LHPEKNYRSPDGQATLEMDGGVRILRLAARITRWATTRLPAGAGNHERGDAIRFWIVALFDQDYTELVARQALFDWRPYQDELRGMLAGMRDALAPEQLLVTPPDRPRARWRWRT